MSNVAPPLQSETGVVDPSDSNIPDLCPIELPDDDPQDDVSSTSVVAAPVSVAATTTEPSSSSSDNVVTSSASSALPSAIIVRLRANTIRSNVVPVFQDSPRGAARGAAVSSSSRSSSSSSPGAVGQPPPRESTEGSLRSFLGHTALPAPAASGSSTTSSSENTAMSGHSEPPALNGGKVPLSSSRAATRHDERDAQDDGGEPAEDDPLTDALAELPTTAPKDEEEYAARQKLIRLRAATVVTCLSPSTSRLRQGLIAQEAEEEAAVLQGGGGSRPSRSKLPRPKIGHGSGGGGSSSLSAASSGAMGSHPSSAGAAAAHHHHQQHSIPPPPPAPQFHFAVNNEWMEQVRKWQQEQRALQEQGGGGVCGADADVPYLPARLRHGAPPPPGISGATQSDGSSTASKSVENWSVARRLGFPCSISCAVADAEYEAAGLMDAANAEREQQWATAIKGIPLLASSTASGNFQLRKLCRQCGVPPYLRGIMWLTLSGVANRIEENNGMSASLLRRHGPIGGEPQLTIDKDLERTFPDHPYFAPEDIGMPKMERVLHALCWRNPLLNYCQSFNFLVAILLLVTDDEEATFWLMCHILEEILPNDFYGEGLVGLKVDQEVMEALVQQHLPKLSAHFSAVGFDVRTLVPGWLMSLFVNTFPVDTVLRIWDVLLTHPSGTLDSVLLPASSGGLFTSGLSAGGSSGGDGALGRAHNATGGKSIPPAAAPSATLSPFPLAVLLGFLKLEQDALLALEDSSEILWALTQHAAVCFDSEALVKEALRMRVAAAELHSLRRQKRLQMYQREANRRVLRSGFFVKQFRAAEETQYVPEAVDVGGCEVREGGTAAGVGGGAGGEGGGYAGEDRRLGDEELDEEMQEMNSAGGGVNP